MPPLDPDYHRKRYQNDPKFREAAVGASRRYRERKQAEDPEGWADARRVAAEKLKEKYHNDPEYRAAYLAVQRARQQGYKAAREGPATAIESEPPPSRR